MNEINLDLSKLAGVGVNRADISRWLRIDPRSVIAGESKGVYGAIADGKMSAFIVIDRYLREDPASLGYRYALSWAKFLITGERDEYYPPTPEEFEALERERIEKSKTPRDKYNEASLEVSRASELVNKAITQVNAAQRMIATATETLNQWQKQLEQALKSETESQERKEAAWEAYQQSERRQQPQAQPEPAHDVKAIIEAATPPQVRKRNPNSLLK